MGNLDKWELKHVKDIARYEKAIQRIYTTYTQEAAKIGASISGFDPTKPLSFADYPLTNKLIKDLQRRMAKDIKAVVVNGVDEQWALSDDKAGELVEELFADLTDAQREAYIRRYLTTRERAREAFKMRKDAGLGLSDRVWQYTDQYKEEIEMAIDLGLREGESAAQMTLSLRKYLNNPDMLFRRVRDEHGMLHLSKRAKAYHPGQGVYRSSYKNARRLAATETNMAYRSADYQRNQSLDFVVGIRIKLSNNHTLNGEPFTDICDWLSAPNGSTAISGRGCYPKDFKFTGWHPLCRCFIQTIHKTREEIAEDARRIRQGLSPLPPSTSKNYVGDVPDEFKAWCKLNAARVERAKSLPYFIRDNRDYYDDALNPRKKTLSPLEVAKHRHEQRTPEHIESVKNRWHERQEYIGGFSAEQLAHFKKLEAYLGIKRGLPMSVDKADKQNANPNYVRDFILDENGAYKDRAGRLYRPNPLYTKAIHRPYAINCQTCAPAYMLRLQGFDVTAKPNTPGSSLEYLSRGMNVWDVWQNADGTKATHSSTWAWMNSQGYKRMTEKRYLEFFEEQCKEVGVYELSIGWKGGGGHATILQRFTDGSLKYIEPQADNSVGSGYEWEDIAYLASRGETSNIAYCRGIMRIDDKLFNTLFTVIFNK